MRQRRGRQLLQRVRRDVEHPDARAADRPCPRRGCRPCPFRASAAPRASAPASAARCGGRRATSGTGSTASCRSVQLLGLAAAHREHDTAAPRRRASRGTRSSGRRAPSAATSRSSPEKVSWRSRPLATSSSQMLRCRSAPLTGSVTVKTSRDPSGENSSSPMRAAVERLLRRQRALRRRRQSRPARPLPGDERVLHTWCELP